MSTFERFIRPKPAGDRYSQQASVPIEGRITKIVGHTAFFVIDDLHEQLEYGPAVLPPSAITGLVNVVAPPAVGDTCLVVFTGGANKHPWIISWTSVVPWPT